MGEDGNGQMGFQHSDKGEVNMPMSSVYGSGDWNPSVSMSQNGHFGASSMASHGEFNSSSSYSILLENHQGISATSHLDHYASDPNLAGTVPRIPIFGSGNFSEMVSSFGLQGVTHNSNAICPAKYTLNSTGAVEKASIGAEPAEKNCRISEEKAMGLSPNGKRKRELDQNASRSVQKDCSTETAEPKDHDDKKTKTEQNTAPSSSAKQTGKQTKDDAQDGEAQKANYIHVRARRGQATNSHSLAERVRREKISERMRLLQELVPGCNKITGKAVMLDEIINYVQSLQQQVEFLSMKLATVNPELNCDIDRILSKDILNSRSNAAHILGFNPGMSSTHDFTQGIHLGNLSPVPNTASQFHPIPQAIWDTDMQGLLHMGFDSSNPSLGNLEPNGSSKPEH